MSKELLNEREFELINIIGPRIGLNQRDLSRHMNLSLGNVNMLLRRMISKGFLRIKQLDKRKVEYILTPKGFAEKMRKSVNYTLKTINSIGLIKERLKKVLKDLVNKGERNFYIWGESDFAVLVEAVLKELCKEEYSVSHINEFPKSVFDGVILVCKEVPYSKDEVKKYKIINIIEQLASDDEFVKEITSSESLINSVFKEKILVPNSYDYIGVYLTEKCHLACAYCITDHQGSKYRENSYKHLSSEQWIEGLNRLELPLDVPITLQGGEPFLYKGIWEILENTKHKVDIMTALPSFLTVDHFKKLKTLKWNKRESPYPTIRVSYHKGQNNYKELIERIAEFQKILSIGLYYLEHPSVSEEEINEVKVYANKYNVELRSKEFLGEFEGVKYGTVKFPEAVKGEPVGGKVKCKNTVVPIAPDGLIYLCHSDLYANRRNSALGNIMDDSFVFPKNYITCFNYGLCNECDIKIKTNHYQQYGYTSVDIKFENE